LAPSSQIAVVGGGLAGLAAALALASAGRRVKVFEARPFLGGRATSYPLNTADEGAITIDNCQHVLLRCCTNLIDFYQRLGVADRIHFYREFYWIEPGGRMSVMRRGLLPAPLHFTESFATLKFLSIRDRVGIGRALLSVRREYGTRTDLDRITMMDWLREKKQGTGAVERFWRQILVSAISEDLERMAAIHGLQVFAVGFLSSPSAYEMGVPNVPLADLYGAEAWARFPQVEFAYRSNVQHIDIDDGRFAGLVVNGDRIPAEACVLAVPFEKIPAIAPGLALNLIPFTHSPITGIHLWFDRPITDLPHATLLDRTIQWMYNKEAGKHIQLVVSASRSLVEMGRAEVIEMALRELKEFFPKAKEAVLQRAHVVKEVRAIFSAVPGLETVRPKSSISIANLYLAGDWTRSGWPATMEGAVRSGYLAAEALLKAQNQAAKFLLPDVA
jgi:zeta-carotene desaturase